MPCNCVLLRLPTLTTQEFAWTGGTISPSLGHQSFSLYQSSISHALKDNSLRDRFEIYCSNKFNLHLIVTDTHLFLALPRLDGSFDLENIIISRDPQALQWAGLLFYHFQSRSEKVDLATF